MENFDRENIDELLEIRHPLKFYTIWYFKFCYRNFPKKDPLTTIILLYLYA